MDLIWYISLYLCSLTEFCEFSKARAYNYWWAVFKGNKTIKPFLQIADCHGSLLLLMHPVYCCAVKLVYVIAASLARSLIRVNSGCVSKLAFS